MAKVLFSVQYEINPDKRDEYLKLVKELKNLLKAEGLLDYSVYEQKHKPNHFEEIYTFDSSEAYDNFEDAQSERINILISTINNLSKDNSTKYTTLYELANNAGTI
jgi:quinol monooxygenase YgiN